MAAPLESQIAAKSLQKIKRQSRARHAKADNRQRWKHRQSELSQNRRRAEYHLNGEQRDVRRVGIIIFCYLVQNKINRRST